MHPPFLYSWELLLNSPWSAQYGYPGAVWPLLMVTLVAGSQLFLEPPLFLTHPQYKARFIRPVSFYQQLIMLM